MSKRLLEDNIELGNALVDMYAICGKLEKAQKTVNDLSVRDVVSWNALISGYAEKALDSLKKMQLEGQIMPDAVTFLCVLNACSHSGLVEKGYEYFKCMTQLHKITANTEQYNCMTDLLVRIGHFDEACDVVLTLQAPPDAIMQTSLLASCKTYGKK